MSNPLKRPSPGPGKAPDDRSPTCYECSIRRASRSVTRLYDRALAPIGLSNNQFSLLGHLRQNGSAPVGVIARWIDIDKTSMGRTLLPLERLGAVTSEPGADRRTKIVSITEIGQELYRRGCPLWQKAQAQFQAALKARKTASLLALLDQVTSLDLSVPPG